MGGKDDVRRELNSAIAEAHRVGESPQRADRLADRLPPIARTVEGVSDLGDDPRSRILAALESAERVLRRDDDGREAARHLQTALRHLEDRPRTPSPFLDD